MSQINSFQMRCQLAIQDFAASKGFASSIRKESDVFEKDKLAIEVKISTFSFWLYPDGAGASGPGLDRRFEIYDFESLTELETKFLYYVKQLLERA